MDVKRITGYKSYELLEEIGPNGPKKGLSELKWSYYLRFRAYSCSFEWEHETLKSILRAQKVSSHAE